MCNSATFFLQKLQNSPTEMKKKKQPQAQESSSGQMCLNPQLSLVAVQAQEFKPSAYLQPAPAESALCRYSHEGPVDSHPTSAGRITKPGLCRCCCILSLWFLYHQKRGNLAETPPDSSREPVNEDALFCVPWDGREGRTFLICLLIQIQEVELSGGITEQNPITTLKSLSA